MSMSSFLRSNGLTAGVARRRFLGTAAAAGLALPFAGLGLRAAFGDPLPGVAKIPGTIKLAWNENAVCLSPVALAVKNGIFAKYGIDVELVNFAGSTDALLEAIATGKADAGVGMVFRWLKALEQGFDVKLVAGTHGGCSRLVGSKAAGVTELSHLKGKTIAISDMASPAKNFFGIMLLENGIDPNTDVEWRSYPAQMLGVAVQKGEAQAIADGDPNLFLIEKHADGDLIEIMTNTQGPYEGKTCCVIGVRGQLIRDNLPAVTGLSRALLEASDITAAQPEVAAAAFAPYTPASVDDLTAVIKTMTYKCHPTGGDMKQQLAFYTAQLKRIGVIKPSTDPDKFADHIYADVQA